MTSTIKIKFNITLSQVSELLSPPSESRRTRALLDKEFRLSSSTHPTLRFLRGLATTIAVATYSLFNAFYYAGRTIKDRIIKARHPEAFKKLSTSLRPALILISSFIG